MDAAIWITIGVGTGGAGFSWAVAHFYYRRQAQLKTRASSDLERNIRQHIGEIRGRQVSILQVESPTILVDRYAREATWIKKGAELGSRLPGTTNRQIAAV